MNIIKKSNRVAAQIGARHMRLKSRVIENVTPNMNDATYTYVPMLYTAKVQVKILFVWVTVWAETCDYSDGDTRPYIKNCAEEVRDKLTERI